MGHSYYLYEAPDGRIRGFGQGGEAPLHDRLLTDPDAMSRYRVSDAACPSARRSVPISGVCATPAGGGRVPVSSRPSTTFHVPAVVVGAMLTVVQLLLCILEQRSDRRRECAKVGCELMDKMFNDDTAWEFLCVVDSREGRADLRRRGRP